MKRIPEKDIEGSRVKGIRGFVELYNIITLPFVAGVRIVSEDSEVPQRVHAHPEKQIIYVIEGNPMITNRMQTLHLKPGDFIILEPNEKHYIITENNLAKIFEIKYPE
ncbi:MAG: cupin domain-containing protein [Candidatus Lokiarchaeota archaeon]|nr:cupin domain-containing protein [Candidatus Lokiarchaeota archaeon]